MNKGFDLYEFEILDILLFLQICRSEKIILYKLKKIDKYTYQFYVSTIDRYKLKKHGVSPILSIGILHYFTLIYKNILNIIGVLSFVGTIFLCNSLILEIEIKGNNPIVNDLIVQVLKEEDIHPFRKLCDYKSLNTIYDKMKDSFKQDIDYLNVYQSGSVFVVEYTNSVGATPLEKDFKNIYASKDGFIKYVDVKSGNILVSENMYVKKGDLLVSNTITSTSDEVVMVPVEGDVYAYTYQTITASMKDNIHDDGETFSYLLFSVRNQIKDINKIDKEQIILYTTIEGKKVLEVQYIFIEQIGVKES